MATFIKAKTNKGTGDEKITHFKTPSPVLGVFELPVEKNIGRTSYNCC